MGTSTIRLGIGLLLTLCGCNLEIRGPIEPRLGKKSVLSGEELGITTLPTTSGTAGGASGDPCPTGYCLPRDSAGWTQLAPTARVVYVSSSTGSDENDGLSPATAKRTIAAGKALIRDGYPDWLVLKPGDVFTNETFGTWCASGPAPERPVVIASYDAVTGSYSPSSLPPKLLFGSASPSTGFEAGNFCPNGQTHIKNVVISGIHFEGNAAWAGGSGVVIYSSRIDGPGHHHILLEDVTIAKLAAGLSVVGAPGNSVLTGAGRVRYITMHRSRIYDVGTAYQPGVVQSSVGMFLANADHVLLSQSVLDRNGWEFDRNTGIALYNTLNGHNLYANPHGSTDVVNLANISSRASATGFRACLGKCLNNLLLKNPAAMDFSTDTTEVRDNVVLDAQDIYHPDYPATSNACLPLGRCGRAMGLTGEPAPNAVISGNVVANNEHGTGAIQPIVISVTHGGTTIARNTVYRWTNPNPAVPAISFGGASALTLQNFATAPVSGVRVYDNVFYQPVEGSAIFMDPASFVGPTPVMAQFYRNRYFNTSSRPFLETTYGWLTNAEWRAISNDTSVSGEVTFVNAARSTIATYLADRLNISQAPDATHTFLNLVRQQHRGNWNNALTAETVNAYIRGNLAVHESPCQRADLNGDTLVNQADLNLFMILFAQQDPRADFDLNGSFTINDYQAFLNAVATCQ
ncbi:MAG: hypothetical protein AB7P04_03840 [Bacteriovoracia bacterium]